MAKGLGSMMAEAAMASADKSVEMICPLCGQPMVWEQVAWFCRSGERRRSGSNEPCDLSKMQELFLNPDAGRWIDDWQGAVLAAVVVPSADGRHNFPVQLRVVRGYAGCTNLSVSIHCPVGQRMSQTEAVQLVHEHGWTWAEWTGRE